LTNEAIAEKAAKLEELAGDPARLKKQVPPPLHNITLFRAITMFNIKIVEYFSHSK
jgi:hypothetical protein